MLFEKRKKSTILSHHYTTVDGSEIPNHQLTWCWYPVINGINYQPQLVSRISSINSINPIQLASIIPSETNQPLARSSVESTTFRCHFLPVYVKKGSPIPQKVESPSIQQVIFPFFWVPFTKELLKLWFASWKFHIKFFSKQIFSKDASFWNLLKSAPCPLNQTSTPRHP